MDTYDEGFIIDNIRVIPKKDGTTDLWFQGYTITHLPLGIYLVVEPDGSNYMLWYNDVFTEWFKDKSPIFEEDLNRMLPFFRRMREIIENEEWCDE